MLPPISDRSVAYGAWEILLLQYIPEPARVASGQALPDGGMYSIGNQ